MNSDEIIILNRDVDALLVPSGAPILLRKNTEVILVQSLGGSFTVNIWGNFAHINNKDADALGKPCYEKLPEEILENTTIEELIQSQLKTCYDPEIPVNIVDLGLIYDFKVKEVNEKMYHVTIKMTLTAPGCGMGPTIATEVQTKVMRVPHVVEVDVEIVFDPPWNHSMMSEAAKLELGMFY